MKTYNEHIEDLENILGWDDQDDVTIREAINFIRWQHEKIEEITKHALVNLSLYNKKKLEVDLLRCRKSEINPI